MRKVLIVVLSMLLVAMVPASVVLADGDAEDLENEIYDILFMVDTCISRYMNGINATRDNTTQEYTPNDVDITTIEACKIVNPLCEVYSIVSEAIKNNIGITEMQKQKDNLINSYNKFMIDAELEYERNDAVRLMEKLNEAKGLLTLANINNPAFNMLQQTRASVFNSRLNKTTPLNSLVIELGDAINIFKQKGLNPSYESPKNIVDLADLIKIANSALAAARPELKLDEDGAYTAKEANDFYNALEASKSVFLDVNRAEDVDDALAMLKKALTDFNNYLSNQNPEYKIALAKLKSSIEDAKEMLKDALDSGAIGENNGEYNNTYANDLASAIDDADQLILDGASIDELTSINAAIQKKMEVLTENMEARENLSIRIDATNAYVNNLVDGLYDTDLRDRLDTIISDCINLLDNLPVEPSTESINNALNALAGGLNDLKMSIKTLASKKDVDNLKAQINDTSNALKTAENEGKLKPAINKKYDNKKAQALSELAAETALIIDGNLTEERAIDAIKLLKASLDDFMEEMKNYASRAEKSKLSDLLDDAKKLLNANIQYKNNEDGIKLQEAIDSYNGLSETVLTNEKLASAIDDVKKQMGNFEKGIQNAIIQDKKAELNVLLKKAETSLVVKEGYEYDDTKQSLLINNINKARDIYNKANATANEVDDIMGALDATMKDFVNSIKKKETTDNDDTKAMLLKIEEMLSEAKNKLDEARIQGKATMNSAGTTFVETEAKNLYNAILTIGERITIERPLDVLQDYYNELTKLLKAFESSLETVDNKTLDEQTKAMEKLIEDAKDVISTGTNGKSKQTDAKRLQQLLDEAKELLDTENPDQAKLKEKFDDIQEAKAKLEKYIEAVKENREMLANEIAKAQKHLNDALDRGMIIQSNHGYDDEAANKLLKAIQDAHELSKQSDADLDDFKTAMDKIGIAVKHFNEQLSEKAVELDKTKLSAEFTNVKSAIEAAEKGWTKYPTGALNTMKSELQAAQFSAARATKQNEIDAILTKLKASLDSFLASQIKEQQANDSNSNKTAENNALNGLQNIDGKHYYYENGIKTTKTGWILIDNIWYYLDSEGAAITGWLKDKNKWYYLHPESGQMQTGWLMEKGKWYFLKRNGDMMTGWLKDKDKWYYLRESGAMETGWILDKNKWYYLEQSGKMKTGWLKDKAKWYYLNSSGAMATGWIKPNTNWYYLYENGAMAENTWVGVYRVGPDGAWLR